MLASVRSWPYTDCLHKLLHLDVNVSGLAVVVAVGIHKNTITPVWYTQLSVVNWNFFKTVSAIYIQECSKEMILSSIGKPKHAQTTRDHCSFFFRGGSNGAQ